MNIIEIPINHKMFYEEFQGEIYDFIYDDFGITLKENNKTILGLYVYYKKNLDGTLFQLLIFDNKPIDKDVVFSIYLSEENPNGLEVTCNTNEIKYLNMGHYLAELVTRTICYIMSTNRRRVTKQKGISNINHHNQPRQNKYKNKKIYLLDEIVEYVDENGLSRNKHNGSKIQCPCWSVRGHYRHYKSGKVIFVENYKKGKERDKIEPENKTYTV